ncbi:hypothetical protein SDC9_169800 [bioreactor metagenome]|uniref:Uncharacterized protein n=1 Tax=bioreactor metagenome TaxID=1076179 RepID=A0A645G679_9ZZZZ
MLGSGADEFEFAFAKASCADDGGDLLLQRVADDLRRACRDRKIDDHIRLFFDFVERLIDGACIGLRGIKRVYAGNDGKSAALRLNSGINGASHLTADSVDDHRNHVSPPLFGCG